MRKKNENCKREGEKKKEETRLSLTLEASTTPEKHEQAHLKKTPTHHVS